MKIFMKNLKGECIKIKRTAMPIAHILVAVGVAGLFLFYDTFAPWNEMEKILAYYQALGIAFPFLIGIFCESAAEQEENTGNYFYFLSATKRKEMFYSKYSILILCGAVAIFFASGIFGTVFYFLFKIRVVPYSFYWISAFLLLGSNLYLYGMHLFYALQFPKGVSVGMGILESLLNALLLTGLGDNIWKYIPVSWSGRIISHYSMQCIHKSFDFSLVQSGICCIVVTVSIIVFLGIWSTNWEGRKE